MKLFLPIFFFLLGCLSLGLVMIYGKFPQAPVDRTSTLFEQDREHPSIKGFQLSPKNYDATNFLDFFELNQQLGGTAVASIGSVSELSKSEGAPVVLQKLASEKGFTPVISIHAFDRETGKLSEDFLQGKEQILNYVRKYQPKYLGIGVEVNLLYEKSPAEFEKFVKLFTEYGEEIHAASKSTHIFPSFQLEKLKGLRGGLFGGVNNESSADWSLLLKFPSADLIGFSTYPTLIYKSPEDIPGNYYKEIFSKTTKRVIFSEIGWLNNNGIKGWESSLIEQESFLRVFNNQLAGERVTVKLWSFLFDQPSVKVPFRNMGFRAINKKTTDNFSPAEIYWKKM